MADRDPPASTASAPRAGRSPPDVPDLAASARQTHPAVPPRLRSADADATPVAPPVTNGRPVRRNCRACRFFRLQEPRPTSPPDALPEPLKAPGKRGSPVRPGLAQAMPCGRLCRSGSMAAHQGLQTPQAPCTPGVAPTDARARRHC